MKKLVLLCAVIFTLGLFSQANAKEAPNLINAVEQGNIEEVKKLLAEGADVNAVVDKTPWTPLHYAANQGNLKIAKLLIKNGADVNAHSNESETPLYVAVLGNDAKMVKYLTSQGADVNISLSSWTPLFHASLNGYKKIIKLLLKNGADVNVNYPIWAVLSCQEGCSLKDKDDMLKEIIKYGGDIDKPMEEPNKMTALDKAVMDNNLETAKMLFKLGAKIEKGFLSKTYLTVATIQKNKEMLKLLLDNGADINAKDNYGNTPLNYATAEDIKDLLIKRGAKYGEDLK